MKKLFYIILSITLDISCIFAQIQTDIEWSTLANSDWPMIKHDPQFTGRSPYKGPQSPTIIWTVDMQDGIFSGPVIGEGGNLFFGSYYQLDSADHFYSYAPNGNLRWNYKLGTNRPPQSGILIDSSNTIYFGSLDKYFYALNPNGSLKWKYETSAPIVEIAMPNIDLEGRLYITNGLGELYSLNPDGTLNWNVKYEDGFIGKSPVFSPDGNTIYITGKDSNLFAINLDGSIKWKYDCANIMRAPLVDSYGNIYILPFQIPFYLYSLDSNGDFRWQYQFLDSSTFKSFAIPTIDKMGNIYVISIDSSIRPNRALISLDYEGNYRWGYIFEDPSDDFWQPLICDSEGTVYVGSTFGYYYYAISSDGQLKWKLPLNDYQVDNTGAISKDGTLYLGVHKSSLSHTNENNLIAIWDTTTTGIKDESRIVADYSLFQNYPNPFNPSTTINYAIMGAGLVKIKVYDILGSEVSELINETKEAGYHSVEFTASNLPSGVYIYTLQVNGYHTSKKMLLLK